MCLLILEIKNLTLSNLRSIIVWKYLFKIYTTHFKKGILMNVNSNCSKAKYNKFED